MVKKKGDAPKTGAPLAGSPKGAKKPAARSKAGAKAASTAAHADDKLSRKSESAKHDVEAEGEGEGDDAAERDAAGHEVDEDGEVVEVASESSTTSMDGDDAALIGRTRPTAPPNSSEAALSRTDPLQAYMREVQRHPLLTPEEEHELAVKYCETGDVKHRRAPGHRQPAAGGQDRLRVSPRLQEHHGPHPGGQHRPDAGGQELRSVPRRQALVATRPGGSAPTSCGSSSTTGGW